MKSGTIIGAGIAGLTTAIALAERGIEVKVYEQATELTEVGAGIWVAPNGLKIYDKLGLAKEVIAAGKTLEKISIVDLKNKPISIIDGERIRLKHGFKTVAIHRADLQSILVRHVTAGSIVLNKRFKSYSQSDKTIVVAFDDGTSIETDFLITADGLRSNGRLQTHPTMTLRYSGQTCWRFVIDFQLPDEEAGNMYEIWSGKKGLRVGYSPINDRQMYVFITNFEKAGGKEESGKVKAKLLNLCDGFPEIVKQMIHAAAETSIVRTELFDFKPIKNWVDKRCVLLGDAAHATTPNLGQGASQAIEDAYVVARELSLNNDIETGFRNFQQRRIDKASFITDTSWLFSRLTNTSGLIKTMIKCLMRTTPDSINEKQLDKIFSIDN
jgi:2-polyprenyl-6-methoxyphenol hydroxylase-like FAD-dependent oxidoreductase